METDSNMTQMWRLLGKTFKATITLHPMKQKIGNLSREKQTYEREANVNSKTKTIISEIFEITRWA